MIFIKKLIKIFLNIRLILFIFLSIPMYFLGSVILIFIRLVSPIFLIRIHCLSRRIGHLVANSELILLEKKLNLYPLEKPHLDLFYMMKVPNYQIYKMLKRSGLNLLPSYILHPIRIINNLIPGGKQHDFANHLHTDSDRDTKSLFNKNETQIYLTKEEMTNGKKILKEIGLSDKDKFVCVIVRDNGYLKNYLGGIWEYHSFRNYNIDNFKLAIETLINKGYFVFRMGRNTEKKLTIKNRKFLDYSNSKYSSDFMDVFLGANCDFCISTSTGFDAIPFVFRKPIAFTHCPVGIFFTFSNKYIAITKSHYSLEKKRNLSLSEIFECELAFTLKSEEFNKKVELIENTPEELNDLALEMVELINNNFEFKEEAREIQKKFRKIYKKNIIDYCGEKNRWHGEIKSNISVNFVKKNYNFLN